MPSAYSVPMASDVLPDPDTPTTATIHHNGTSTSMSRRLLCRAPRTLMTAGRVPGTEISPVAIPGTLRSSASGYPAGGRASRSGAGLAPGPARPGPGALRSGVDRSAVPAVEAPRLHDLERRGGGEDLDVRGGQHAGVLGDDRRGRPLDDSIEVAFDPGPGVLPARHVVGHRVDRGQRLSRAGVDVGDVGLVHRDVIAGGEPAQVPADEVRPRVVQRDGRGAHVPDDVVAEVDVVDGHPAGVDHVDEHQGVVAGEVDVDV